MASRKKDENGLTVHQAAMAYRHALIVAYLEQGVSWSATAVATGVDRSTVGRVAKRWKAGEAIAPRAFLEQAKAVEPVKLAQAKARALDRIADATDEDWRDMKLDRAAVTYGVLDDKQARQNGEPGMIVRHQYETASDAELADIARACIDKLRDMGVAPAIDVTPTDE